MYSERSRNGNGLVVIVVIIFIALATWWIESRFSAGIAAMVLGGLAGVICVIIGYMLNLASTTRTLEQAARFNSDLALTERARQGTFREQARGEREAFNARAKLDVIDAKRIDHLAQQRAGLLIDVERQKQIPRWDDDDSGDNSFKFLE